MEQNTTALDDILRAKAAVQRVTGSTPTHVRISRSMAQQIARHPYVGSLSPNQKAPPTLGGMVLEIVDDETGRVEMAFDGGGAALSALLGRAEEALHEARQASPYTKAANPLSVIGGHNPTHATPRSVRKPRQPTWTANDEVPT